MANATVVTADGLDLYNQQAAYAMEGGNITGFGTPVVRQSLFTQILVHTYTITIPVLCVIGVVGNVLAFFIFMSKSLRRTSCSWYLAGRSVSDGGFLFGLFLTWLSDVSQLKFFHTEGLCQIIVFMAYVFAFLSVWLTVVVTMENYIRICRPFSVQKFCTVLIAQRIIVGLILIGLVMYNFPFWTDSVFTVTMQNETHFFCRTDERFAVLAKWLSFWDMLITLVIPSLIIIVLMVAITFSLLKSLKRQSRLQSGSSRSRGNGQSSGGSCRSNTSPQAKVTRMLFAVSFFFLLLNGPYHIIRMRMAVVSYFGDSSESWLSPTVEQQIQVVCQIIYHLSFAVNLIIYLTCGDNFRKQFKETYFSFCIRHRSPRCGSEMTAMSTVRLEEIEHRLEDQTALIENGPTNAKDNT